MKWMRIGFPVLALAALAIWYTVSESGFSTGDGSAEVLETKNKQASEMPRTEAAGKAAYVEGVHYQAFTSYIEETGAVVINEKRQGSTVQEFFSYGCVHCKNFAPLLSQWVAENSAVNLVYMPIVWGESSELYARVFYAIEQKENFQVIHEGLFDVVSGFNKNDSLEHKKAEIIRYMNGLGVQPIELLDAMDSAATNEKIALAVMQAKQFEVTSTPTLVVAEKYKVLNSAFTSIDELLEVSGFLLQKQAAQ